VHSFEKPGLDRFRQGAVKVVIEEVNDRGGSDRAVDASFGSFVIGLPELLTSFPLGRLRPMD
jgi:hypothetical protein